MVGVVLVMGRERGRGRRGRRHVGGERGQAFQRSVIARVEDRQAVERAATGSLGAKVSVLFDRGRLFTCLTVARGLEAPGAVVAGWREMRRRAFRRLGGSPWASVSRSRGGGRLLLRAARDQRRAGGDRRRWACEDEGLSRAVGVDKQRAKGLGVALGHFSGAETGLACCCGPSAVLELRIGSSFAP